MFDKWISVRTRRRADALRDAGRHRDAATLYEEALNLTPGIAAVHIQAGHMFKEAGELGSAERHYAEASRLTPEDPDLALQLGHYYKVAGRLRESAQAYARALSLRSGWGEPARELESLRAAGWRDDAGRQPSSDEQEREIVAVIAEARDLDREMSSLRAAGRLVPELQPRKPADMLHDHHEAIVIKRMGKREHSPWGMMPTLRGLDAIRGFCISATPILDVRVTLNGLPIHRGSVRGGYPLDYEKSNPNLHKYVFNIWHDVSRFSPGCYDVELSFLDADGGTRRHRERVQIAAPLTEDVYPACDGVVTLSPDDPRSVDEQVDARPSVVRAPPRGLRDEVIRKILVLRTDQLGDMVASIPAMLRLRELFPDARIVGLLTAGNVEFAQSLGVFDDIVLADFPDDMRERRRVMTLEAQEALRTRLMAERFDLAIDLAESFVSRPLLLLSGARILYGFYDREWPWLTIGFESNSHDVRNGLEMLPHSSRNLAMIERLGTMLDSKAHVVRRDDLTREMLVPYGIGVEDRFVVLHTGARIVPSRWPHYPELAARVLERTGLKVVMLADDGAMRSQLPEDLAADARFQLIDQRLPFADFDALLSFCSVFVGNDSGPKHLAAVRGANVVSLHSARVNWNEWGQEIGGSIISRKVPCAGCHIFHDADECGRDWTCVTRISVDEVYEAMSRYL